MELSIFVFCFSSIMFFLILLCTPTWLKSFYFFLRLFSTSKMTFSLSRIILTSHLRVLSIKITFFYIFQKYSIVIEFKKKPKINSQFYVFSSSGFRNWNDSLEKVEAVSNLLDFCDSKICPTFFRTSHRTNHYRNPQPCTKVIRPSVLRKIQLNDFTIINAYYSCALPNFNIDINSKDFQKSNYKISSQEVL